MGEIYKKLSARGRRQIAAALILVLTSIVPIAYAVLGDVDADLDIDNTDADQVLEHVIGTRSLSIPQQIDADVDDTGTVSPTDAMLIRQFVAGEISAFTPRLPWSSSSIAISRDGNQLAVVNPDNNSISFIDPVNDTLITEVFVGREPASIVYSRDGLRVYITNSRDRNVSVVDTASFIVTHTIAVGVEPYGIVINNRGDTAYVANMMSATVSVIDLLTQLEIATIPVAEKPQALAVSADSASVYVTHLNGGVVTHINTNTLVSTNIAISSIPFDSANLTEPAGVANRMKGLAIHPGNGEVWLPHILSNSANTIGHVFNSTIFPALSVIDSSNNSENSSARMTLFNGFPLALGSPEALAFSPDGSVAYMVSAASNDLSVINTNTRQQINLLRDIGDNPRGIVVTPDGNKAYVMSRLSPQVAVIDLNSETQLSTINVASNLLTPQIDNGRRLFFTSASPQTASERFFSCESCHFDGRDDGQVWFFANGPRRSQSMAGGSEFVGLLHHNGDRANWQDFAAAFTSLQGGTGLSTDQLNDLADFGNHAIRLFDNPHLNDDLSFTQDARAGRRLFNQAGCADCHNGPFLTDADGNTDPTQPLLHDVGTFVAGTGTQDQFDRTRDQDGIAAGVVRPAGQFESTLLLGVHATGPFLHDGRSPSLLDTLTTDNPNDFHGVTSNLNSTELNQIVSYMEQLHITNARVKINFPTDNTPVTGLTQIKGEVMPDVTSVQIVINNGTPIIAQIIGRSFTATVPSENVPSLLAGTPFSVTALATTQTGEPGRDDIDLIANFGQNSNTNNSSLSVSPNIIPADDNSTATVTITPRDSGNNLLGSGLNLEVQTTLGALDNVQDNGDGTYIAILTAGTIAGVATITANEVGQASYTTPALLELAAGDVNANASQINLNITSLEADGIGQAIVTVTPRDAFANLLSSGQNVTGSVTLGNLSSFIDQNDGTYRAIYTAAVNQGSANLTVDVNGTSLTLEPVITLVPDNTAPAPANSAAISFSATNTSGVSQVSGGAGSVEAFASVRLENLNTNQVIITTADVNGSFSASINVAPNEIIQIRIEDLAGNTSTNVEVTPFVLSINAISGLVQTVQSDGSFAPVVGETVNLDVLNLTAIPSISFTPSGLPSVVTDGNGQFSIPLPDNFIADPDLAVTTSTEYALINDINRDVVVDEIATAKVNMIANNDFFLQSATLQPAVNFTPAERVAIESSLRAAISEQNLFGLDPTSILFAIDADIFTDTSPDALDIVANNTFRDAAESAGSSPPPVTVTGTVTIPAQGGGSQPLANVRIDLATSRFPGGAYAPDPVAGIFTTTDSNGNYSITIPGFLQPGAKTVLLVAGDLPYDGSGSPGVFTENLNILSLGGIYTQRDNTVVNIDMAGQMVNGFIQREIPSIPDFNSDEPGRHFNPDEVDQLLVLLRSKIAAQNVSVANKTLQQIFLEIFNNLVNDSDVTNFVTEIADTEPTPGLTPIRVNPTTLEADGYSQAIVSIEPLGTLGQQVGEGKVITLESNLGTVESPAVDNGDGTYSANFIAGTVPGTATIIVTMEGTVFEQQPQITLTADTTAPTVPDTNLIEFINVGTTATIIGLPGAAEANSLLQITNNRTGLSYTINVNPDGSFRADIPAQQGDSLSLQSDDRAGNSSTSSSSTVTAGLILPGIANPDAIIGTPTITAISESQFTATLPSGYTYLAGAQLDLQNQNPTTPLQLLLDSSVNVPSTSLLLVQAIEVEESSAIRVIGKAISAGGVLLPDNDNRIIGLRESGQYAYIAAPADIAYAYGRIIGSQGQGIQDTLITMDNSPFVDLTRSNGDYLIAGEVNSANNISVQQLPHDTPTSRAIQLPLIDTYTLRDMTLTSRANISHGFTRRFIATGNPIIRDLNITPDGQHLHAVQTTPGDIQIIDTNSFTQTSLIDDFASMTDLAIAPNGQIGMVSYINKIRDLRIDIEDLGAQIFNIGFPHNVAMTPNGELALVISSLDNLNTDSDPDALFFISTFAPFEVDAQSIPLPADPVAIAINRSGTRAYIVSRTQSSVTTIDILNRSVIDTINISGEPIDVQVSHDGSELYIADFAGNQVHILDAALAEDSIPGNETLASINVGNNPDALALSPDNNTLLVTERDDDTVSVIDLNTRTISEIWATSDNPLDIAIQPDGTKAYVLDTTSKRGILEVPLQVSDNSNPVLLDIGPQDRAEILLQDSPIEIVFNEAMDVSTLTFDNIEVLDENALPVPGVLSIASNSVSVVFEPTVRYLLNSNITINLSSAITDKAGNNLSVSSRTIPTQPMQLPDLTLINIDLNENGIIATGQPGAVEPNSVLEITNLTSNQIFRLPNPPEGGVGRSNADGSFQMTLEGLDNDGYELVTSIFGGRAATDPATLQVNFTIDFANPNLITYDPGPQGTLLAVGAAGAVDIKTTKVVINNLTKEESYETTAVNADGSFQVEIFAQQGDQMEIVTTLLDVVTLDPVVLNIPDRVAPVIDFITPDRFNFGDPVNLTIVGDNFGDIASNIRLEVDGEVRTDFILDVIEGDEDKQGIQVTPPSGGESSDVTVTFAGQTSNSAAYSVQFSANTDPFAEEVIEANVVGDANLLLGFFDGDYVDLGEGGSITIRLGTIARDGRGLDLRIFEDSVDSQDCYEVQVSASSSGPFESLGEFCGTQSIELQDQLLISHVRIIDANDGIDNFARIGAVQVLRIKISLAIQEVDIEGNPIQTFGASSAIQSTSSGIIGASALNVSPSESDAKTCVAETKSFSVNVSPSNNRPAYYRPGCNETITWSVSGGGSVSPTTGSSTTFTAGNSGGTSTIRANVSRTGDSSCADSGSTSIKVDVIEVEKLEPDEGIEINDGDGNPDTRTFIVGHQPGFLPNNIDVTATPNPNVDEGDLPACWTMSGGSSTLLNNKKIRQVSKKTLSAGEKVTAKAGMSMKETTIVVMGFKVEGPGSDICDGNPANISVKPLPSSLPLNYLSHISSLTLDSEPDHFIGGYGNIVGTTTLTFDPISSGTFASRVQNTIWYSTDFFHHGNVTSTYTLKGTGTIDGNTVEATEDSSTKLTATSIAPSASCLDGSASWTTWFSGVPNYVTTLSSGVWTTVVTAGSFVRMNNAVASVTSPINSQFRAQILAEENYHVGQLQGINGTLTVDLGDAALVLANTNAAGPFAASTQASSRALAQLEFANQRRIEDQRSNIIVTSTSFRRCDFEREAKNAVGWVYRFNMHNAYPMCP